MTGDGLKELVVVTTRGVQVLVGMVRMVLVVAGGDGVSAVHLR